MKMTLYDYANQAVEFDISADLDDLSDIQLMVVQVISGDEVVNMILNDGQILHYDSCDNRAISDLDCTYFVFPDDIDRWMHLVDDVKVVPYGTRSYLRKDKWYGEKSIYEVTDDESSLPETIPTID